MEDGGRSKNCLAATRSGARLGAQRRAPLRVAAKRVCPSSILHLPSSLPFVSFVARILGRESRGPGFDLEDAGAEAIEGNGVVAELAGFKGGGDGSEEGGGLE